MSCSCLKNKALALYSSDCFLKTLGYRISLSFNIKLCFLASKVTAYILSFVIPLPLSQNHHFCCLTVLLSTHFQHSLLSTVSQNPVRIFSVNFRFDLASPLSEICQRVSIVLRIKSKHFQNRLYQNFDQSGLCQPCFPTFVSFFLFSATLQPFWSSVGFSKTVCSCALFYFETFSLEHPSPLLSLIIAHLILTRPSQYNSDSISIGLSFLIYHYNFCWCSRKTVKPQDFPSSQESFLSIYIYIPFFLDYFFLYNIEFYIVLTIICSFGKVSEFTNAQSPFLLFPQALRQHKKFFFALNNESTEVSCFNALSAF